MLLEVCLYSVSVCICILLCGALDGVDRDNLLLCLVSVACAQYLSLLHHRKPLLGIALVDHLRSFLFELDLCWSLITFRLLEICSVVCYMALF